MLWARYTSRVIFEICHCHSYRHYYCIFIFKLLVTLFITTCVLKVKKERKKERSSNEANWALMKLLRLQGLQLPNHFVTFLRILNEGKIFFRCRWPGQSGEVDCQYDYG